MRRLKICNIGWAYSIHVERWARWFASKGHEVSIITDLVKDIKGVNVYGIDDKPTGRKRFERYKEIAFNIYYPPLNNIARIIRLKKRVSSIGPDIVHSHSLWYPGYLGTYLNFHPFVVTVLNGDVLWKKDNINLWQRLRTKIALKNADLVTGESEVLANACIAHGVKRERTHVIRRGVDLKKFNIHHNKESIRKKLGLPVDCKIILSPRNTGYFYNLERVVSIIPKVADRIKNVLFIFVWHSDVDGKNLKEQAKRLGILEKVRFAGKVDHELVSLYHKCSDVMISISDKDSGPVALQEAMACGDIPVISDLPCVRELAIDKVNGFLVAPSNEGQITDAIVTLLLNDNLRAEIAERNWRIAQDICDEEKWMEMLEVAYFKVVEEKNENFSYRQSRNIRKAFGQRADEKRP